MIKMWTMLGYSGQFKGILDNLHLMFSLEGTCTCTLHLTAPHTFTNTVNVNLYDILDTIKSLTSTLVAF
jgi:hypothetical protein